MTFGEKLQFLRRLKGISQEELAEHLEVSRQAISKWENGTSVPDSSKVVKLSRLFSVSTDYLLLDEIEELPGTVSESSRKKGPTPSMRKRIPALIMAGMGLLGHFTIYLLSRIIAVPVPWTTVNIYGETRWHWSEGHTGHSYKYFVQEYDLKLLTALFSLLLAVGLLLLALRSADILRPLSHRSKKQK